MQTLARRSAVLVMGLVALGLLVVLLSTSWGLASEYGTGSGSLAVFAVLPIGAAACAAGLARPGRATAVALVGFVVVTVAGLPVSAELGQRDRHERFVAEDASFTCNGPNAEAEIPAEVDGAFHVPAHPAGFTLYGPVSSSQVGCTAAIHGDDPAASFAAWRGSLLDTGWKVERDDAEVVVVDDGVRLTLYVDQGLSMLNATAVDADVCADGRATTHDDGRVSAC